MCTSRTSICTVRAWEAHPDILRNVSLSRSHRNAVLKVLIFQLRQFFVLKGLGFLRNERR